jgi:hypothetical protein
MCRTADNTAVPQGLVPSSALVWGVLPSCSTERGSAGVGMAAAAATSLPLGVWYDSSGSRQARGVEVAQRAASTIELSRLAVLRASGVVVGDRVGATRRGQRVEKGGSSATMPLLAPAVPRQSASCAHAMMSAVLLGARSAE